MNRKLLPSRLVACVSVCLCLVAPIGAQEILNQVRGDRLRLGIVAEDNHPFVYRMAGEWTGYEIALAARIADELNAELQIRPFGDVDQLRSALLDDRIHLAFSKLFRSLSHAEIAMQSSPVGVLKLTLVVNRTAYSRLRTKGDLIGDLEKGVVPVATVAEEAFIRGVTRRFPEAELSVIEDYSGLWRAVETGEATAIALDEAAANRYFLEHPERGIGLRIHPLSTSVTVVALLPWRDDFFAEWVDILIEGEGDPVGMQSLRPDYTID